MSMLLESWALQQEDRPEDPYGVVSRWRSWNSRGGQEKFQKEKPTVREEMEAWAEENATAAGRKESLGLTARGAEWSSVKCSPACLQAPPSMGFSRQKQWSVLPFPPPGDLPNPGIKPRSPTLQADALPSEPPGKPNALWRNLEIDVPLQLKKKGWLLIRIKVFPA